MRDAIAVLWAKRWPILLLSLAAALATLLVNYLLHDYYRATVTLLPSPEKGKLSALGQFAEVAALAGVNVPGTEAARLYPSIVMSESVLGRVIGRTFLARGRTDTTSLSRYYDVNKDTPAEAFEYTLRELRKALSPTFDPRTGIVTITLVMDDPELAATVLNATVEELDRFMRSKKISNASEQVQWLEVRLRQVQDSLRQAENALRVFREKNRRIADSPELLLKQERLSRDVQVNSTVFIELKKQYELARLEEVKNLSVVNVMDWARTPVLKIGPRRKTNSAIAFLLSMVVVGGYFIAGQSSRFGWREAIRGFVFKSGSARTTKQDLH